jgi:diketogulonate reductase-like aldo/keto reductase
MLPRQRGRAKLREMRVEQIEENIAALDLLLDQEELTAIDAAGARSSASRATSSSPRTCAS